MITAAQLAKIYDRPENLIAPFLPPLRMALTEFRINTPKRIAAFVAQIGHESGGFRYMHEIADGAAYDMANNPRLAKTLGNTEPGDGPRFKGRGVIQITGRANYQRYGDLLGIDLVNFPDRAADPEVAFRVAASYWNTHNLSDYADRDEFDKITKVINGGLNGKTDRDRLYARALEVLGGATS